MEIRDMHRFSKTSCWLHRQITGDWKNSHKSIFHDAGVYFFGLTKHGDNGND